MFLNREHPSFDEAMEVLCLLPVWPCASWLKDIRADMGYRSLKEVENQVTELRRRGFQVVVSQGQVMSTDGGSGRTAWIERGHDTEAKSACRNYFSAIYGRHSPKGVTAAKQT